MLNAATPDLFASFYKRKDRQKAASSYKPVRSNAAERAKKRYWINGYPNRVWYMYSFV